MVRRRGRSGASARRRSRAQAVATALRTLDSLEGVYVDLALSLSTVTVVLGIAMVAQAIGR